MITNNLPRAKLISEPECGSDCCQTHRIVRVFARWLCHIIVFLKLIIVQQKLIIVQQKIVVLRWKIRGREFSPGDQRAGDVATHFLTVKAAMQPQSFRNDRWKSSCGGVRSVGRVWSLNDVPGASSRSKFQEQVEVGIACVLTEPSASAHPLHRAIRARGLSAGCGAQSRSLLRSILRSIRAKFRRLRQLSLAAS